MAWGQQSKVTKMVLTGDLNKIVKPLWHRIIFSFARVYTGSSAQVYVPGRPVQFERSQPLNGETSGSKSTFGLPCSASEELSRPVTN